MSKVSRKAERDSSRGRKEDPKEVGTATTAGRMLRRSFLTSSVIVLSACSSDADHRTAELPAVESTTPHIAASARGFPALRDLDGRTLASGNFAQWMENGLLHIRIRYDFPDGRRIEELAVVQLSPEIIQREWRWEEARDGEMMRRFEVDFAGGTATAAKAGDGDPEEWSEQVEIQPGRTFAGFGFTLAIKALRERLIEGETLQLGTVAFTPRPRALGVDVSHGGVDEMSMSGRVLRGDRFLIRPRLPWLVELFVDAPEVRIWLTRPPPAEFLRFEGPMVEPNDPMIRVDLLPGAGSSAAEPVETRSGS